MQIRSIYDIIILNEYIIQCGLLKLIAFDMVSGSEAISLKILMINKFLHPNGGSETYIFKLGKGLQDRGHEVQYFGMEHEGRVVGNRVDSYTSNMDFHGGSKFSKLLYPISTIYSVEARKKLRLVLEDFQPDVCHLNNFNYQLTPSIILEIRKWEKASGHKCRIVYTAHDGQLVCPNHLMKNPVSGELCCKCMDGGFLACAKGKCIHGSLAKSVIGTAESWIWKLTDVYKQIDVVISPSNFLAEKLKTHPALRDRIHVMHNFVDAIRQPASDEKMDYVLYYGRYSEEKGIGSLLKVVDQLPHIPFVFAGDGPLKDEVEKRSNLVNKGFVSGEALVSLVKRARLTVVPSECYENCPFTVMESQMYGTPVLGADIGGIPELIHVGQTGELFESGNVQQLTLMLEELWADHLRLDSYAANCDQIIFDNLDKYIDKLMLLYA